MQSGIKNFQEFEYGLIQYCKTRTLERINIGVVLKDGNRVDFKMIDSFHQIVHAYDFQNPDGLDFALEMFKRTSSKANIFKNGYQICNCIEIYIPDFPLLTTKDNFEEALENLWQDCVKISRK